jgi:hypothetical protein
VISLKKRIAAIAAATVVGAVGSVVGVAAPASAYPWGRCDSSFTCIWKDANFYTDQTNRQVKFQRYIPNYAEWNYSYTNINSNDTATSIFNNGISETAYMYRDAGKGYQLFSIPAGNSNGWLTGGQGDSISSGYYYTYN